MHDFGVSREDAELSLLELTDRLIRNFDSHQLTFDDEYDESEFEDDVYDDYLPSEHIWKYTIRVSIKGSSPLIWRKFVCPSNISLRHLADFLEHLMEWDGRHMNQFIVGRYTYYVQQNICQSDFGMDESLPQEEYMLSDLLRDKGKTILWEYDFGDSWMHEIRLSSVSDYKEGEGHDIKFIGGRMATPPEDCGGIDGYEELLRLHEKRKSRKRLSSEERERLKWYGMDKDFDPEYFDEFACIDFCDLFSEGEEGGGDEFTGGRGLLDRIYDNEEDELLKHSAVDDER